MNTKDKDSSKKDNNTKESKNTKKKEDKYIPPDPETVKW